MKLREALAKLDQAMADERRKAITAALEQEIDADQIATMEADADARNAATREGLAASVAAAVGDGKTREALARWLREHEADDGDA